MAANSDIKSTPIILKNRRPSRGRCVDASRIKPLHINFKEVREQVKVISSAGRILKDLDVPAILAKRRDWPA